MERLVVRRAAAAAVLALLTVLAAALVAPRSTAPVLGAAPSSGYVALPEGVTQVAAAPRTEPRTVLPALAPPAPAPVAVVRPFATPAGDRSLSPVAVPAHGGRSPPVG